MDNLKWIVALSLLVASFVAGLLTGREQIQDERDKENLQEEVFVSNTQAEQAKETVKIVTEYVDRIKIVKVKGDTIIKEVPVYVTSENDNHCIINLGFVELHNAAAKNQLPNSARNLNEAASGIKLSTVSATVADNYERCHQNAEQLMALQEWAKRVVELNQ